MGTMDRIDQATKVLSGGRASKSTPPTAKPVSLDDIYKLESTNWLKTSPYAFKTKVDDTGYMIFYLPISPQNLTITTHFATNMISTLYGTVEEHSEQRYFDISIQGTTGFAPAFDKAYTIKDSPTPNIGRESYGTASSIMSTISSAAQGLANGLVGKLNQIVNQATTLAKSVQGKNNTFESGVKLSNSGYTAFHNLYRFLLAHKKYAASGKTTSKTDDEKLDSKNKNETPLYFINFKDNNQYSCVIQRFNLERSAENPMLYNYSIQLRAYNLSPISMEAPAQNSERLKMLGLNDSQPSIGAKFKVSVNGAKGLLNSIKKIRGA